MPRSPLADAFGHHVWATTRLIDACMALTNEQLQATVPGTYGSIIDTFAHLAASDRGYLSVLSNGRLPRVDDEELDLDRSRRVMEEDRPEWSRVIAELDDPDEITVRTRPDGSGNRAPAGIRLAQALHHGTDHRSQIATILTSLGMQPMGIAVSLVGVLVILLHGDFTTLGNIEFNKGDLIFTLALFIFGLYSVLSLKRPAIHGLSFVAFTFGAGAACLIPLLIRELSMQPLMQVNTANLLTLAYVALFPSTLAYLCFNRGVQLIGANRAAPFFHVVPVFGTVMSIVFLGERPQPFHFLGFALVLAGVFVASRKRR